jgi:heat shock protein HtpX
MTTDSERRRRRSRRHTVLLLVAMAALLAYCGWVVAGWEGAVWSIFASAVMLPAFRRIPSELVLRAIGARPVLPSEAPELYDLLDELCRRAGVAEPPRLCWVGERFPVAFTIGDSGRATIVLSQGLVSGLEEREVRGVLAHEIVHVRNRDIALMQLAMVVGRLVRVLAQIAIIAVFLSLFLRAAGAVALPLGSLLLLAVAPTGVGLLQLALSREREAEADLEAAELTGDPEGLASALAEIRRRERAALARRFPGARMLRMPALLRDHPATEERIRRLLQMAQPGEADLRRDQMRHARS